MLAASHPLDPNVVIGGIFALIGVAGAIFGFWLQARTSGNQKGVAALNAAQAASQLELARVEASKAGTAAAEAVKIASESKGSSEAHSLGLLAAQKAIGALDAQLQLALVGQAECEARAAVQADRIEQNTAAIAALTDDRDALRRALAAAAPEGFKGT